MAFLVYNKTTFGKGEGPSTINYFWQSRTFYSRQNPPCTEKWAKTQNFARGTFPENTYWWFPPKFIVTILKSKQPHEDATCQVIHDVKLTESIFMKTGIRQSYVSTPTIFQVVVEWVMRQSTADAKTDISVDIHETPGETGLCRYKHSFSQTASHQREVMLCRLGNTGLKIKTTPT